LNGQLTLGVYALSPKTPRSPWVAIDADYENALEDLLKLQWELRHGGVEQRSKSPVAVLTAVWVEHVDTSNVQIPAFATQKVHHGETKGIWTPRRRVAKTPCGRLSEGKYRATQIRGSDRIPSQDLKRAVRLMPGAKTLQENAHLRQLRLNFLFPELLFRTSPRLRFAKPKTTL
jgi:hypothetical protein